MASKTFLALAIVAAFVSVAFMPTATAQDTGTSAWTVLVYLDAEGNLESSGVDNMLEMEASGAGDRARVLVQMDRGPDYDDRDGDWEGTRRYEINKAPVASSDGMTLSSRMVQDMGEVNMGDPKTLVDFLNWGVKTAPADHYLIILWDHGGAWDGLAWDHTPIEDHLTLAELGSALDQARRDSGLAAWDIVYFDACVMGSIEVAHAVGDTARLVIASEELVPGAGGSYRALMEALREVTAVTPEEMAGRLVRAFGARYAGERGTDAGGHECARGCGTRAFSDEYVSENDDDAVLSWYHMSKEPALWSAWSAFNVAMTKHAAAEWHMLVREARAADRYNYEDAKSPDAMDIGDFARRVKAATNEPELRDAATAVIAAVDDFVGGYTISPNHKTSTGVMAKFPVPTSRPAGAKPEAVHATNAEYAAANNATSALASAAQSSDNQDPAFGDINVERTANGVRVTVKVLDENPHSVELAVTEEESENGEVLAWVIPTRLDPIDGGVLAVFEWDGTVLALDGGAMADDMPVIAPAFRESLDATEYVLEGVYRVGEKGAERDAFLRFDLEGTLLSAWIIGEGASQIKPRVGDWFAPVFLGWDADGEEIDLMDVWVPAAAAGTSAWRLASVELGAGATGFAAYAEDLAGNGALSEPIVIEFGDATDDSEEDGGTVTTPSTTSGDGKVPAAALDDADDNSTPGLPLFGMLAALGAVAVMARRRRA